MIGIFHTGAVSVRPVVENRALRLVPFSWSVVAARAPGARRALTRLRAPTTTRGSDEFASAGHTAIPRWAWTVPRPGQCKNPNPADVIEVVALAPVVNTSPVPPERRSLMAQVPPSFSS